jgi:hypothetical protein
LIHVPIAYYFDTSRISTELLKLNIYLAPPSTFHYWFIKMSKSKACMSFEPMPVVLEEMYLFVNISRAEI